VAKYVKSNAIVFCKGGMTMGVGAGQMSRLDSARIASHQGRPCQSVLGMARWWRAMPSSPSAMAWMWWSTHGATCVIQPGGSMRDQEVIDAANERGVSMVFSGVRHFRH